MKTKNILSIISLLLLASCSADKAFEADVIKSSDSHKEPTSSPAKAEATGDPSKIFDIRKPDSVSVSYEDDMGNAESEKFYQQDWICSFDYKGDKGFFYIQTTPVNAVAFMSVIPEFSTDKAEFYINGKKETIDDAVYEWGGNHHNDNISFLYKGNVYSFAHSSFGFGWRSCQEMDCLTVSDEDANVIEDGCTSERSIPVICRQVTGNKSYEAFEDTFEKCPGDSNDDNYED